MNAQVAEGRSGNDRLRRLSARLAPGAGGFFSWWGRTLASWLPLRTRQALGVDRGRYTVLVNDGGPDEREVIAARASELRRKSVITGDRVDLGGGSRRLPPLGHERGARQAGVAGGAAEGARRLIHAARAEAAWSSGRR